MKPQTAEIINLLYEATQGPPLPLQAPVLNPTGGVRGKQPVLLDYKKDNSRPGGGIFIAQSKVPDFRDLPEGLVISKSDDEKGDSEGENASPAAAASSIALVVANDDNDQARVPLSSSHTPSVLKSVRKHLLPPDAYEQSMFTVSAPSMNLTDGSTSIGQLSSSTQRSAVVASGASATPLVNFTPLTGGARGDPKMNVNPTMNAPIQPSSGSVQVMNVLDAASSGRNLADFQMADNGFLEGLPGNMFDWGKPSYCWLRIQD